MAEHTCCFKIDGPWLTQLCRTLWADEDNPHKALAILDCLVGDSDGQEMNEEIALRILTGRGKIVGNSTDGMYLEEDHVDFSEHGNALSLQSRFRRLSFMAQELEFEILCRNQIKAKRTEHMASPWGCVHVPFCVWENITSGKWSWKDLEPYIRGGIFPRTEESLRRMRSWYRYEDDEEIEFDCEEIRQIHNAKALSDEDLEKAVESHTTNVGFPDIGISENTVDKFIKEQREMDKSMGVPIPAENVFAQNGWIAPNGDFLTCGMIQHDALADRMGSDTKKIEQTHVRISINPISDYRSPIQFIGRHLTQRQKDKIWDWCDHHKVDVPPWVFDDEGTEFSKEK